MFKFNFSGLTTLNSERLPYIAIVMEGPDEPVFSGFRDAEILVASNKGQVFSEFISSFDKQIDISKQGEKEKTKSNPSFGQGSGFSCLMTTPLKLSIRRNSPKLILY